MDKKSIIGIAVVAVLFLGFAYFNSQQQKEYLEQKAAYEAYVDSVAAAARAAAPVADSLASGNGVQAEVAAAEAAAAVRERQVETLGESLTAAREAEAEEFIVENDVMAVLFSTRGGQIKGVTLKDGKDVTVIATGFDKAPGALDFNKDKKPAEQSGESAAAGLAPLDFDKEKAEEEAKHEDEPDPFDDIFKIFNRER